MREAGARQLQARLTVLLGRTPCIIIWIRACQLGYCWYFTFTVHVLMQIGGCCTPNGTMQAHDACGIIGNHCPAESDRGRCTVQSKRTHWLMSFYCCSMTRMEP